MEGGGGWVRKSGQDKEGKKEFWLVVFRRGRSVGGVEGGGRRMWVWCGGVCRWLSLWVVKVGFERGEALKEEVLGGLGVLGSGTSFWIMLLELEKWVVKIAGGERRGGGVEGGWGW